MEKTEARKKLNETRKDLEKTLKLQYDLSIDIGPQKMKMVYEFATKIQTLRMEEKNLLKIVKNAAEAKPRKRRREIANAKTK